MSRTVIMGREVDLWDPQRLRAGDRVRIVRRVENELTWNSSGHMDWTIGQVGEVVNVRRSGVQLTFRREGRRPQVWTYDFDCVGPV